MRTIWTLFISIAIFYVLITCLVGIGTKAVIVNNFDFDNESLYRLGQLSPVIANVTAELQISKTKLNELDKSDLNTAKEFLADYIESKTKFEQFINLLKTLYQVPSTLLLMFPVSVYIFLEELYIIDIVNISLILLEALLVYIGVRSGNNVVNT